MEQSQSPDSSPHSSLSGSLDLNNFRERYSKTIPISFPLQTVRDNLTYKVFKVNQCKESLTPFPGFSQKRGGRVFRMSDNGTSGLRGFLLWGPQSRGLCLRSYSDGFRSNFFFLLFRWYFLQGSSLVLFFSFRVQLFVRLFFLFHGQYHHPRPSSKRVWNGDRVRSVCLRKV